MTAAHKRRKAIARMEDLAQALIAQAYTLCHSDNHTIWQRRDNSAELLRRGRAYANAVAAVRRS
jgi:hypothetical protein